MVMVLLKIQANWVLCNVTKTKCSLVKSGKHIFVYLIIFQKSFLKFLNESVLPT